MKIIQIFTFAIALLFTSLAIAHTKTITQPPEPEYQLQRYPQFPSFADNLHGTGKYIIINRVSQQLIVVEDYRTLLEMKVIIGKRGWTTPARKTSIEFIITNPYWNLPMSISVRETIPKIKKNIDEYRKRGYEIIHGKKIHDVSQINNFNPNKIKIRQKYGPYNALGQVKFKLGNNMGSIYLHDTPNKNLFNRKNRKLSHGCVRLEKPLELLSMISDIKYVKGAEKWNAVEPHIPVYIVDWKRN